MTKFGSEDLQSQGRVRPPPSETAFSRWCGHPSWVSCLSMAEHSRAMLLSSSASLLGHHRSNAKMFLTTKPNSFRSFSTLEQHQFDEKASKRTFLGLLKNFNKIASHEPGLRPSRHEVIRQTAPPVVSFQWEWTVLTATRTHQLDPKAEVRICWSYKIVRTFLLP